jgi:hypothetical protein
LTSYFLRHSLKFLDIETRTAIEALKAEIEALKLSRTQRIFRALRQNKRIVLASTVLIPAAIFAFSIPNTFLAGTPTVAADVNANFTVIGNAISAMENKSWRVIFEMDVPSNSTSVNISGLDGNSDKSYMLIARFTNPTGSGTTYYAQPNGDSASNYAYQYVGATGGTPGVGSASSTGYHICSALSGTGCEITGTCFAPTGLARVFFAQQAFHVTPGAVAGFQNIATSWNNTGSNITSLLITSGTANSIGAGSHIELWARR